MVNVICSEWCKVNSILRAINTSVYNRVGFFFIFTFAGKSSNKGEFKFMQGRRLPS